MDINNATESHVTSNVDKICSDLGSNTQARLACMIFLLSDSLIKVFELINKAKSESGTAAIKAGFTGADETATAGLFQLGGGAALAATGVAQGAAGCKNATEISQAVELRNSKIAYIENNMRSQDLPENLTEDSDITVQVEALDEPSSPVLDETEEEIFYDAEETLSSKQTKKPEEKVEEAKIEEKLKARKKASREEDKLIRKIDQDYNADKDLAQAKAGKLQGLAAPGQGLYNISQGLAELEKYKNQKENIQQQVKQEEQSQEGNTAEGLIRNVNKLTEFDPLQRNSSSLRG